MTGKQYSQLLRNRQPRGAHRLLERGADQKLLRSATYSLRQRELGREVLEQLLKPAWIDAVQVVAFEKSTLTLTASDPTMREELRRRLSKLQVELAARVPGVRRVVLARSNQERDHDSRAARAEC